MKKVYLFSDRQSSIHASPQPLIDAPMCIIVVNSIGFMLICWKDKT